MSATNPNCDCWGQCPNCRAPASPVQGAASAVEDNKYDCPGDVRFSEAAASASDRGAAVKPWRERVDPVDGPYNKLRAADAEVIELRAALAERAQAAQPSEAGADDLTARVRALAEKWNKEAIATGFAGSEPAYELFEILDATPAPEQPKPSGCSKCGSTDIHACPGAPIPEWTPEAIAELHAVLAEYETDDSPAPEQEAAPSEAVYLVAVPPNEFYNKGNGWLEVSQETWARIAPSQRRTLYAAPVEQEAAQVGAVADDLVPNWAGEFKTFNQWVNRANRVLTVKREPAICVDAKGRRCYIGKDFMLARDENAFPVRYFWDCATATNTNQPENLGAANTNKGGEA